MAAGARGLGQPRPPPAVAPGGPGVPVIPLLRVTSKRRLRASCGARALRGRAERTLPLASWTYAEIKSAKRLKVDVNGKVHRGWPCTALGR